MALEDALKELTVAVRELTQAVLDTDGTVAKAATAEQTDPKNTDALSPQQKAARTRAAKKAAQEAQGKAADKPPPEPEPAAPTDDGLFGAEAEAGESSDGLFGEEEADDTTDSLFGDTDAEPDPEPDPEATQTVEVPEATHEAITEIVKRIYPREGGREVCVNLLKHFGAAKVSEIPKDKLEEAAKAFALAEIA